MRGRVVRSLAFPVDLPAPLRMLLAEFRLLVNRSIRIALREDLRIPRTADEGRVPHAVRRTRHL